MADEKKHKKLIDEDKIIDEMVNETKEVSAPGEDRSEQFQREEEIKQASFEPKKSEDNPL